MNGYQRIITALKGEQPDAIPVMLHNFMMAAKEAGYTQAEYRSDPHKIADSFIQAVEKYQYDGILVDIDTVTLAGAVDVPVDFPEHEPARSNQGCLADLGKVDDLESPDISKNERIQIWLEAVRILVKYFGKEVLIRGNCDQAPFSLASMMRTPAIWMLDLLDLDNQERVHRLLSYCLEAGQQFLRLMDGAGAHMLSNGDSPAGPEMISPELYREFAKPYETKMAATAREITLNRCSFIGNIDPSGVLALGDPQRVASKTRELLELFGKTPGFILNAGCAIPAETPPKNIRTLIRTAREYL